jgi:hypothetical protein
MSVQHSCLSGWLPIRSPPGHVTAERRVNRMDLTAAIVQAGYTVLA